MSDFFFYMISAMILVFAFFSVTAKKIFHSAVYLLFSLINVAALYFYLNYEFLAAVQIVVYVGGVVVLILFSLFLTQRVSTDMVAPERGRMITVVAFCVLGFFLTTFFVIGYDYIPTEAESVDLSVKYIGRQLLNYGNGGYVLPFEAVSVLLLAALVGSIAIAFKTKKI